MHAVVDATNVNEVVELRLRDGVAIIKVDSPPVNALGAAVRAGIAEGLARALADPACAAIVLCCGGATFFAGADIRELGKPPVQPDLNRLVLLVEDAAKPVVAAIHGKALGGGLELALACHARVAAEDAGLGLPEVKLGLLPGAGGTQRLPRLIGMPAALDMMLGGKPVAAPRARALGLADAVAGPEALVGAACEIAREMAAGERAWRPTRERPVPAAPPEAVEAVRRAHRHLFKGYKAPAAIVDAVEAAGRLPFGEGMARERELFLGLIGSREAAAQRHIFFAERATTKVPGIDRETPVATIARVGVVGAGTMGRGIAMAFLDAGYRVSLVDREAGPLEAGVVSIRKFYERSAAKGRIAVADVEARLERLAPTTNLADLAGSDLVVEAVFETLALKQEVFRALDGIVGVEAILATNTSFLDVDEIAAATRDPGRVVGLHFFSPANVMRLLEVVRGSATSPRVIATAMGLGRTLGKVAVLSSGRSRGFIANRMMAKRTIQASALLLRGAMPWDVDRVLEDFGFAMGPFAMMDLVGLDVVGWNRETSCGSTIQELLCEAGRWGQKRGAGFYDYDGEGRRQTSPTAARMIEDFAARKGLATARMSDTELLEYLLFPVVNEGARILEEGVALRALEIDAALVAGYNWPVYTGGPMFWAETVGLGRVATGMRRLEADGGDTFAPSALLVRLAERGEGFHEPRNGPPDAS